MVAHSAPGVNLLSKKKLVFDERRTLVSKVKKGAGLVLVVYGAIIAVLVGVNVFLMQRVNAVALEQGQAKAVLAANTVLVSQYEQVVAKVGLISDLMNSRQEVVDLWQKLRSIVPPECTLTQFSVDGDVLTVGIQAPHMVLANTVLDVIEPSLPALGASKTTVSISRSIDASYRLDFELALASAVTKE